MNQKFVASQWETLCCSARSTTTQLSQGVSPPAAARMLAEGGKLWDLDSPPDKQTLEERYTRRMALSARLTAIVRADAMARVHPETADEIHALIEQFCDGELPATHGAFLEMQVRNIELTRAISELCEVEMTART